MQPGGRPIPQKTPTKFGNIYFHQSVVAWQPSTRLALGYHSFFPLRSSIACPSQAFMLHMSLLLRSKLAQHDASYSCCIRTLLRHLGSRQNGWTERIMKLLSTCVRLDADNKS